MKELFSLGELYVSDFLKPDEQPKYAPVEMKLMLTDDGFVRLEKSAPSESMWGKEYWYKSSVSDTMRRQLKDIVDEIFKVYNPKENLIFCDIAANDGTMLSFVPDNVYKIAVDPANDTFKEEAVKHSDLHIQDYFSAEVYYNATLQSCDIITCISMFYDLQDPDTFLKDVHECLAPNGIFVVQMSYSALMIKQGEISNICHEHFHYLSGKNMETLLDRNGFKMMDISLNETNCGSMRIYAMKKDADVTKFGSKNYRDVCEMRIDALAHLESSLELDKAETWQKFYADMCVLKDKTLEFVKKAKSEGKTIWGYGASTKFNTTLQWIGLDHTMIDGIAERSPAKFGLKTIGSNIPIYCEEEMRFEQPDYLIIGPFQFLPEFMEREKEYLANGGKFVVIFPNFEIIGA